MTVCSNYYYDTAWSQCTICGANSAARTANTSHTSCACAAGSAWNGSACASCAVTQGQYLYNNTCYFCQTINAVLVNSVPQSTSAGCRCVNNYIFLLVGSTFQCSCNNTAGLFDIGNSAGCGTCSNITGAVAFLPATSSCSCNIVLVWSSTFQKCKCANPAMYLKYNIVCALCSEIPTNAGVNPNTINSCLCSNNTVWHSGYSQCVCIGSGGVQNQYYDGSKCVACDSTTLRIMDGYNRCRCPANTVWSTNTFSCICNSISIPINNVCTACSSIPFAGIPTSAQTACTCTTGWTWNPTSNRCVCSGTTCSCDSVPNTALSQTTKTCQPCSSFDPFADPNWPTNQTQCACFGAYVWQTLTNTC